MLVTTSDTVPGHKITSIEGAVHTHRIAMASASEGFKALGKMIAGRTDSIEQQYSDVIEALHQEALEALKARARDLGCHGIIGLRMDFTQADAMMHVDIYGTAVKLGA